MASRSQVSGLFWNYMSLGMDAAAAHGFHQLRESKPWAARGRITNQAWCAAAQCVGSWFQGQPAT